MLIETLTITLVSLAISTLALLLIGRGQRRPSRILSAVCIGAIEGATALIALHTDAAPLMIAIWAGASFVLALPLLARVPQWSAVGHATFLFLAEASLLYLMAAATIALLSAGNLVSLAFGVLLWLLQAVGIALCLSFTYEMLDVVCRRRWRYTEARPSRLAISGQGETAARLGSSPAYREKPDAIAGLVSGAAFDKSVRAGSRFMPSNDDAMSQRLPRIALHVPCHNEPPDIVIQTLEALTRLDYPRALYDVMVVDNNTSDPALWRPLVEACDHLGFQFLHLEDWPGYKSGALNYALALTPPEVEIIGVVDADYLVEPEFLRDMVGYFDDPRLAFVQTPQDYRDYRPESTFYQRACYHAYRYFFDLSMPSRNERDAIIFGGTMGLIRARALREIGGWDEWCITEDAEASLRLFAHGWTGRFVNHAYGKGLMPLEFDALKRQRFRWCFGGIQILRKHWHMLAPWATRGHPVDAWEAPGLTLAQRYHFLIGGLQWYSDAVTFLFTSLLLLTGWLLVLGHPVALPTVSGPLLALPLTFWATSLLRTLWALRATRRCTWGEALGAVGILWSLSWVVTLACIQGSVQPKGVFLRTPKSGRATLLRALRSTTIETTLGGLCWGLGVFLLGSAIRHAFGHLTTAPTPSSSGVIALGLHMMGSQIGPWWAISGSALPLGALALLQGTTYLAAPALCLSSLRTEASAQEARRRALADMQSEGTVERRLLVGALTGVVALAAFLLVANALPSSPIGQQRQQAVTSLLGSGNPVTGPSATSTPAVPSPTSVPGSGATPGAGGGTATATPASSPTPTVVTTPTATPHPGATPNPTRTPPTSHPTPTPHPHH